MLGLYSMVVAEERLLISLLSKGLACHVFYFNQIADCMVHLLLIAVLNSNCFSIVDLKQEAFYCIILIQKKQKKRVESSSHSSADSEWIRNDNQGD